MKFICQIGIVLILYSVKNQRMEMCSARLLDFIKADKDWTG